MFGDTSKHSCSDIKRTEWEGILGKDKIAIFELYVEAIVVCLEEAALRESQRWGRVKGVAYGSGGDEKWKGKCDQIQGENMSLEEERVANCIKFY